MYVHFTLKGKQPILFNTNQWKRSHISKQNHFSTPALNQLGDANLSELLSLTCLPLGRRLGGFNALSEFLSSQFLLLLFHFSQHIPANEKLLGTSRSEEQNFRYSTLAFASLISKDLIFHLCQHNNTSTPRILPHNKFQSLRRPPFHNHDSH